MNRSKHYCQSPTSIWKRFKLLLAIQNKLLAWLYRVQMTISRRAKMPPFWRVSECHEGQDRTLSPNPQSTCGLENSHNHSSSLYKCIAEPLFYDQDGNCTVPPESDLTIVKLSSPVSWSRFPRGDWVVQFLSSWSIPTPKEGPPHCSASPVCHPTSRDLRYSEQTSSISGYLLFDIQPGWRFTPGSSGSACSVEGVLVGFRGS